VFLAEHLHAKTYGRVNLRLPEAAVGLPGLAQAFEQRPSTVVKVLPQFG